MSDNNTGSVTVYRCGCSFDSCDCSLSRIDKQVKTCCNDECCSRESIKESEKEEGNNE